MDNEEVKLNDVERAALEEAIREAALDPTRYTMEEVTQYAREMAEEWRAKVNQKASA